MTTDRFNPSDIFLAHLKGLKKRRYDQPRPIGVADTAARVLLYVLPLAACAVVIIFDGTVAGPEGILAAAGIFTGAFFMGFTQVAVWRERFTERRHDRAVAEVHQRDSLDEAIAHLLMAMYGAMLLVVAVSVGMNFGNSDGELQGPWAGISAGLGLYVVLLLALILPKLYTAYAGINAVDDEMSGLVR